MGQCKFHKIIHNFTLCVKLSVKELYFTSCEINGARAKFHTSVELDGSRIFTVENEGLYLFYANMLRSSYTTSEINIKIDGQTRCTVYSSEDGSPHGSSSSCSTVEYLNGTFLLNILKNYK